MALLAGARFRPWFWLGLQAGTLFGVGFVTWLQYESLYSIGSLCLWCCLAWVVTIASFWYTAVHNIKHGIIPVPGGCALGAAGVPLGGAGAVVRHDRHADPGPLVVVLEHPDLSGAPAVRTVA